MYKHHLKILIISFALVFSACHNDEISSNSTYSTPATIIQTETELALQAYQTVVENERMAFITYLKKEDFLSDVMDDQTSINKYSILDLDCDEIPEVVLLLSYALNEEYATGILHYSQNTVYYYQFPYRAFNNIKIDGTYHWSGGAVHNGFSRIVFNDGEYTTTDLAYCENDIDWNVSYFIGNESVSEDEFELFRDAQLQKQDAEWHEYSIDAFKTSLASVTEEPIVDKQVEELQ